MQWDELQKLHQDMTVDEANLLFSKGKEYASDADALSNFKKRALDVGVSPKQIAWIFMAKHLDSIRSFIANGVTYSNEPIEGRIADARNYLALLNALIQDEKTATKVLK